MPFEQSRDIFYLSGVDQEESILLFRTLMNTKRNIISKKQTTIAVWEGEKQQRTRISRYWNKDSVLAARF
jgi:Xaa-Pro aminopeptidase